MPPAKKRAAKAKKTRKRTTVKIEPFSDEDADWLPTSPDATKEATRSKKKKKTDPKRKGIESVRNRKKAPNSNFEIII